VLAGVEVFLRGVIFRDIFVIHKDNSIQGDMRMADNEPDRPKSGRRRKIVSVDADTGETLEGVTVLVSGKKSAFSRFYGRRWFAVSQDPMAVLAADKEMTLEPYRVLLYLMLRLYLDNFIYVTQAEVADYLDMKKPNVSRAMKLLERKELILRGPKLGHSHAWRLNPDYGYKGDLDGKVCRPDGKKAIFKVIDGGKKD
jgi:hypothetical protein